MARPSLATDAQAVVDRAGAEARRRAHVEVLPEHVALACVSMASGVAFLTRRTLDVRRLREALEAAVGAIPACAVYRDASAAPIASRALGDLLVAAHKRRRPLHFLPYGDVQAKTLFEVLLECEEIQRHVAQAAIDATPVRRLRGRALAAARARGHRNVLFDHALIALLDDLEDMTFAEAVRMAGHDSAELRESLDTRVRRPRYVSQKLADESQLVLFTTMKIGGSARHVAFGVGPIVVDMLRNAYVRDALEATGVHPYDVLFAYVHGRPPPVYAPIDRGGAPVDVIFHDDPYTTMEFVVTVLKDVFALDEQLATERMIAVHEDGSAAIASLQADRACGAVRLAREAAREGGMPLRIEIV